MSAGDRDMLTNILFKHQPKSVAYRTGWEARCSGCDWVGAGFVHNVIDVTSIHRAHVADVIASSDWLREQRADVCDQIIERIRGMEFLGASSLALGGQVAQQEILVLIEQHKRLVPYRRTEDTDAH